MSFRHRHSTISIQADNVWLDALLSAKPEARALIVFLSTSPIADRDSRELIPAHLLHEADYATLLVNALTSYEEKRDPDARYDVPRLAKRLLGVLDWCRHQPSLARLPIGLHASGTAAAASLKAAARIDPLPFAIVCRSGRIDLAGAAPLRQNTVPIRLIVGGAEDASRTPGERAMQILSGEKTWVEIPGASDRFVEPGTLDAAGRAALEWFEHCVTRGSQAQADEALA